MTNIRVRFSSPQSGELLEQALQLQRRNEIDAAITTLSRVIALEKNGSGACAAYIQRAATYAYAGRLQQAIPDWKSVIAICPETEFALIAARDLSRAFAEIGDFNQAIHFRGIVIQLQPSEANNYNYRGTLRERIGDTKGAVADYSRAIDLNPNDYIALFNRGSQRNRAGDYTAALMDLNRAILLCSTDPDLYFARAASHRALGNPDSALADIDKAIGLGDHDFYNFYLRARVHYDLGKHLYVLADATRAIELIDGSEPKNEIAYCYGIRGLANFALWFLDEAKADLEQAVKHDPVEPKYHWSLAQVYGEMRLHDVLVKSELQRYLGKGGGIKYGNQKDVQDKIEQLGSSLSFISPAYFVCTGIDYAGDQCGENLALDPHNGPALFRCDHCGTVYIVDSLSPETIESGSCFGQTYFQGHRIEVIPSNRISKMRSAGYVYEAFVKTKVGGMNRAFILDPFTRNIVGGPGLPALRIAYFNEDAS